MVPNVRSCARIGRRRAGDWQSPSARPIEYVVAKRYGRAALETNRTSKCWRIRILLSEREGLMRGLRQQWPEVLAACVTVVLLVAVYVVLDDYIKGPSVARHQQIAATR